MKLFSTTTAYANVIKSAKGYFQYSPVHETHTHSTRGTEEIMWWRNVGVCTNSVDDARVYGGVIWGEKREVIFSEPAGSVIIIQDGKASSQVQR